LTAQLLRQSVYNVESTTNLVLVHATCDCVLGFTGCSYRKLKLDLTQTGDYQQHVTASQALSHVTSIVYINLCHGNLVVEVFVFFTSYTIK